MEPNQLQPQTNTPDKNYWLEGILIFGAISLVGVGLMFFSFFKNLSIPKAGTGSSPTLKQAVVKTDLSKYDLDTDGDGFPNFIEEQFNSDPNVSEENRCFSGACGSADISNTNYKKDVMIVFDSSGSMSLLIGNQTRMELAKKAIKSYVEQANENIRLGLFVYGHWGSNSVADKALSCSGAAMIAQIGDLTGTSVDEALSKLKPTGWTPTGLGIRNAAYELSLLPGNNKEIIVVSDGQETCDTNPIEAAASAKKQNIKVSVIGFAVDTAASIELNSIATAGGGGYATANSYEELDRKLNELSANTTKLYEETKCRGAEIDAARACYKPLFLQATEWATTEKLKLYSKEINQDEYQRIDELANVLYLNYNNIFTDRVNEMLKSAQEGKAKINQ